MNIDSFVAVGYCSPNYPPPPYSPAERFPEYPFQDCSPGDNQLYALVRQMLRDLGLDLDNYGTPRWNPLAGVVQPGDHVVVKPNLVRHLHPQGFNIQSMITHASVLRPLIDYIHCALKGEGQICICDAPVHDADFARLLDLSGISHLVEYYQDQGVKVQVLDLREEQVILNDDRRVVSRRPLVGDPLGYTVIDLGSDSHFDELTEDQMGRFYASLYDEEQVHEAHALGVHKYAIANTILDADVVFVVPKIKTHHKAGVSLALKNVISIAPRKQWLPHHRTGPLAQGGDEYPVDSLYRTLERGPGHWLYQRLVRMPAFRNHSGLELAHKLRITVESTFDSLYLRGKANNPESHTLALTEMGAWYGNDTVWRMVLDLNRILFHATKNGQMVDTVQRRYFCLLDGIVGGEGDGPLSPLPKAAGLLSAGWNPVAVDAVTSTLMGIDYEQVSQVVQAFARHRFPLVAFEPGDIRVVERYGAVTRTLGMSLLQRNGFQPPTFWKAYLTRSQDNQYHG